MQLISDMRGVYSSALGKKKEKKFKGTKNQLCTLTLTNKSEEKNPGVPN